MIEQLGLKNFKGFTDTTLDLAQLTVLTGRNNAGKSSLIQALLLMELGQHSASVDLNGRYGLALGDAYDVLNVSASAPEIELSAVHGGATRRLTLRVPDDRAVSLSRIAPAVSEVWMPTLQYLAAERLGPRDLLLEAPLGGARDVGCRGEYTAHVLAALERHVVADGLRHPDSRLSPLLGRQVEAWMQELFGPLLIQVDWLKGSNAATIRFRGPDVSTEWLRPANVGFGLTYALPLIVAGLTAPAGGLILVENPEAHLHPAAQSALGKFLARLPSAGVQCLVETHSEHVVNGIRLEAASTHGALQPSEVLFYFFTSPEQRVAIQAGRAGGLSAWPSGFFDQAEVDLAALSRMRFTDQS